MTDDIFKYRHGCGILFSETKKFEVTKMSSTTGNIIKCIAITASAAIFILFIIHAVSKGTMGKQKNYDSVKKQAVDYIKEKYGITAEVNRVDFDARGGTAPFEGGVVLDTAMVDMTYEGRVFSVYANTATKETVDDYQNEEISRALIDRLLDEIPGGTLLQTSFRDRDFSEWNSYPDYMLSKDGYYDGNDLSGVLNSANVKIIMTYVNTEFHGSKFLDELKASGNTAGLISFDSEEIRQKWVQSLSGGIIDADYIGGAVPFYDYEPHITDRWIISGEHDGHVGAFLRDGGDFMYYSLDLEDGEELSVYTKDPTVPAGNISTRTGYTTTPITDIYGFTTEDGEPFSMVLRIYYPLDKIPEGKNIRAVLNDKYAEAEEIDGYLVFQIFKRPGSEFYLAEVRSEDRIK